MNSARLEEAALFSRLGLSWRKIGRVFGVNPSTLYTQVRTYQKELAREILRHDLRLPTTDHLGAELSTNPADQRNYAACSPHQLHPYPFPE